MLDNYNCQFKLCLKKCNECGLDCVSKEKHLGECNCSTDHHCFFTCEICEEPTRCKLRACHDGTHMCDNKHTCKELCIYCGSCCAKLPSHPGEHVCEMPSHQCQNFCQVYEFCGQKCAHTLEEEHKVHQCGQKTCPISCSLNCGRVCSNPDHLHSLHDGDECIHVCGQQHPCKAICQNQGICEVQVKTEVRTWKTKHNEFTYHYACLDPKRNPCEVIIPKNQLDHITQHSCSNSMHRCIAKCPDCSTFCEKEIGHDAMHSSSAHRNKQDCVFIASTEESTFGDEKSDGAFKIEAGESATPIFCDQSCSQRGRGHTHPKICLEGDNCAAVKYPGKAIHSKLKFYPYLDKTYDLLSCDIYWMSQDWTPPVFMKNEQAQATFHLCKYFCNHPDHGEEKVFCEDPIFHSESLKYHDHNFPCTHDFHSKYDIVFVIDSTGSMSWCFNKVKESIQEILKSTSGKEGISTRFGVVSYTDHYKDDNGYGEPPVKYFANLESQTSSTQALNFLHTLKAGGGGGTGGEAVLDGLHCANTQMQWRDKSQRVYILALDQGPHGQEFAGNKYQYPAGCPCKLQWKQVLNEMKRFNSQFLFVNCGGSYLNLTIDLFEKHYGDGWNLLNLDDVKQFDLKVANFVGKVVESNYEFSIK